MGVSAAVAGFRGGLNRGTFVGETDESLVARARAGDDAAFEAIYDRYARGVLAFCVHMLGNREAGEDALQLTFVSAFRALRRSDGDISLRPWLYTIARNRCLSELRTRRELDVDAMASDRPSREGVADQVQRREDLREMLDDMRRLPADQRAALVLFELGDHSHEEIAAVLGVRREKVKALVFQAREALLRGRRAREHPCADIRERLATTRGRVLPRSVARAHIDRCPGCAAFEREVRRQRAALALILPVVATSELKASVLGSALHGGGPFAAVGATAAGGVGGAGTVAAGGTAAAGGVSGAGAITAGSTTAGMTAASAVAAGTSAAGGVSVSAAAAGTAVIAGAPSVATVASGVAGVGTEYAATIGGVGGLGAAGSPRKGPHRSRDRHRRRRCNPRRPRHAGPASPASRARGSNAAVDGGNTAHHSVRARQRDEPRDRGKRFPGRRHDANRRPAKHSRHGHDEDSRGREHHRRDIARARGAVKHASGRNNSRTCLNTGRRRPQYDHGARRSAEHIRRRRKHRSGGPVRFERHHCDHDSHCRAEHNQRHRRNGDRRRPGNHYDQSRCRAEHNRRHRRDHATGPVAEHGQHRNDSTRRSVHDHAHHKCLGSHSGHRRHGHGDLKRARHDHGRHYRVRDGLDEPLATVERTPLSSGELA